MIFAKLRDYENNYYNNSDIEDIKMIFGGKAANLIRMKTLGMPVPPAWFLECSWSNRYTEAVQQDREYDIEYTVNRVVNSMDRLVSAMQKETMKIFGHEGTKTGFPLLVSVRSGAPVSMPGMMDTILNVGLNDQTVRILAQQTNEDFAWDSYRRLIQTYATVVLGHDKEGFEKLTEAAKHFCPSGRMTAALSQHLVHRFKALCPEFPQDVRRQLLDSVVAVWRSWSSDRAVAYRKVENIDNSIGTGVVVQQMVFGNLNPCSATGVLFTRNPVTGTGEPYGDYLINAQGEDVVDGSSNTLPIYNMKQDFPELWNELSRYSKTLETSLGDMCDIEFTIEDGMLYILQVRTGKRSALASRRIPFELVKDNIITIDRGLEILQALGSWAEQPTVAETNIEGYFFGGRGLVAAAGEVEGVIAFTSDDAVEMAKTHESVILVTIKTDPADMPGIIASKGILTMSGGLVSHAAVVARSWDKTCIVGAGSKSPVSIEWDGGDAHLATDGQKFYQGDSIILKTSDNGAFYLKRAA